MKRLRIEDLRPDSHRLMPEYFGARRILHGGLYVFKPGETPHPDYHVHAEDEVFIFIQGRGVLPIDGTEHPVATGDVIIVEPGEDHHTTSSVEEPLVAAWYILANEA